MRQRKKRRAWKVLDTLSRIESPWLTLIGERLQDETGKEYDYWRVEKPCGMIVVTVYKNRLIIPESMYRPGVGEYTLDFCGGRIDANQNLEKQALKIVKRELNLPLLKKFKTLQALYKKPLNVDSSFTNVKLYAFVAEIPDTVSIESATIEQSYEINKSGTEALLNELRCLQCRSVFYEWLRTTTK